MASMECAEQTAQDAQSSLVPEMQGVFMRGPLGQPGISEDPRQIPSSGLTNPPCRPCA